MDYGATTTCTNNNNEPIGINGWYASGQAYARIYGDVGVVCKGKRFPIIAAGATVVLQAKGPHPFWAKGAVGIEYKILGGLFSGNETFVVEIGKRCAIGNQDPNNDQNKIISSITPEENTQKVNLRATPVVEFNIPINKEFGYSDDQGNTTKSIAKIKTLTMKYGGVSIDFTQQWSASGRQVKLEANSMLPANAEIEIIAEVDVFKNNVLQTTNLEGPKKVKFKTDRPLMYIPNDNIAASYPANGQYNYYRNENNLHTGYIQLQKGQFDLLGNVPENYERRIIFSRNGKEEITIPYTFNAGQNKIEFVMPNDKLSAASVYKMEITYMPLDYTLNSNKAPSVASTNNSNQAATANSGSEDLLPLIRLYTSYFRVSYFQKVMDKLNATSFSIQNKGNFDYNISLNCYEPFDDYETGKVPGKAALLAITDELAKDNWYTNTVYKDIYSKYPEAFTNTVGGNTSYYTIDLVTKKYGEINKIDPVDFFANITSENNEKIIANEELYNKPRSINSGQFIAYNKFNLIYQDYNAANGTIAGITSSVASNCTCAYNNGSSMTYGTPGFLANEQACKDAAKKNYPSADFPIATMPSKINFTIMYKLPSATDADKSNTANSNFQNWYSLMSSQSSTIFKKEIVRP